jgi:hypothetical protein
MTIRLDSTSESVVIVCTDCPHWSGFAFTKDDAWKRAAAHEEQVHPGQEKARNALRMRSLRGMRVELS